jgi:hypothetical protein
MADGSGDHCASSKTDPDAHESHKRSAMESYSGNGLVKRFLDSGYCCKITQDLEVHREIGDTHHDVLFLGVIIHFQQHISPSSPRLFLHIFNDVVVLFHLS